MNEEALNSKTKHAECEEDIRYIQTHIQSNFVFDFITTTETETSYSYYSQLHGIFSALICTYKLRNLEQIVISYIHDEIQSIDDTIRCLGNLCNLRTLSSAEQFAIFQLLREQEIRKLLQLAMEDCDTITYENLLTVFSNNNYENFKEGICKVKYSASKVSAFAQAICIHSNSITDFLYDHTIDSYLQRIEDYNNGFLQGNSLTTPGDYMSYAHLLEIIPGLLGLSYGPISSYIKQFLHEYKGLSKTKLSKQPIPTPISTMLPKIVWYRKIMLEQYISDISRELNNYNTDERQQATVVTTVSSDNTLSLAGIPTMFSKKEKIDAFCAAFASHCEPKNPEAIKFFFWNLGDATYKQINWKAPKALFVAYIHYAYKDHDLPDGTEDIVQKVFTIKGEPINIAGYGLSKYIQHYTTIENEISLRYQE